MAEAAYEIGIATVDATPPLGVMLSGYGSRTQGATEVSHRLRAEAIVCRDASGAAWAIVTSDLIGYPHEMVERLRASIASRVALKPGAIMIAGTHTHSGPAAMQCYNAKLGEVDHAYRKALEPKLVQVVVDAWNAAKPGEFETAWTEAPLLGSNRRVVDAEGKATNEWQDPEGKHPGYFDPSVMVVGVRRPSGELAAVMVNYGVHPVTLGPRSLAINADYPGYMKDTIEMCRAGTTALFALAGAGNINPRDAIAVGAEHPRKMGETLGQIVCPAMSELAPVAAGPVRSSLVLWKMISRRGWPEASGRKKDAEIASEIMALRAGDLVLVGLPGELFSEYVAMIRDASPLPQTAVVSLANDSVGYLPTDEAQRQGGHEVTHRAADALEGSLMEHVRAALAAVAD